MKLGTETNSMTNHLLSGDVGAPEPFVGMGVTILCWTDRHAGTIIRITKSRILVQRDIAKRIDKNGMSESQQYEYTPDPTGYVEWPLDLRVRECPEVYYATP